VSKRIQLLSRGVLEVNQGSLYPALYRLRDRGLIESEFGESEEGRRVKVYSLTRKGRAALAREREGWRLFSGAVNDILATS
jgi:DNA-binding PadR family transcriptional regulator